jgi:transglutaminase-like putative cysteine protease
MVFKNKIFQFFLFCLFLCSILLTFESPIFIISDLTVIESNLSVQVSRSFANLAGNFAEFEFLYPQNYTSSNQEFNIQSYTSKVLFNPEPDSKDIIFDKYGNKILRFSYKSIYGFSVNFQFYGSLKSYVPAYSSVSFPYNLEKIDQNTQIYLEYDQFDDINHLISYAKTTAEGKTDLFALLIALKINIESSVNYCSNFEDRNPSDVLNEKAGNREEILNLYMIILRILGIPVRAACGLGIQQNYEINKTAKTEPFLLFTGKNPFTYLEIWSKNFGWIAFDPFTYTFYSLNNFIRLGHALNFEDLHYIFYKSGSDRITFNETYNIQITKNNINKPLEIEKIASQDMILLSSNMSQIYKNILSSYRSIDMPYNFSFYNGIELEKDGKKFLCFSGFDNIVEIPINSENKILQTFYIEKPINVKKILSKFNFNQNTSIVFSLYKGEQINESFLLYRGKIPGNYFISVPKSYNELSLNSLNLTVGIYTLYIYIEQPDKNAIIYCNEKPSFKNYSNLKIIKRIENKDIIYNTNCVLDFIFEIE